MDLEAGRQGCRWRGAGGWTGSRRKSRSGSKETVPKAERKKTRLRSKSKPRDSRECWVCNNPGHISYLCPEKRRRN